jgi:hypothetical protein
MAWGDNSDVVPYNTTNVGLSITLSFIQTANSNFVRAALQVRQEWEGGNADSDFPNPQQVCILLEEGRVHRRLPFPTRLFPLHMVMTGTKKNIYIIYRMRSLKVVEATPALVMSP